MCPHYGVAVGAARSDWNPVVRAAKLQVGCSVPCPKSDTELAHQDYAAVGAVSIGKIADTADTAVIHGKPGQVAAIGVSRKQNSPKKAFLLPVQFPIPVVE